MDLLKTMSGIRDGRSVIRSLKIEARQKLSWFWKSLDKVARGDDLLTFYEVYKNG
jgi:hypothetical protein